MSRLRGRDISIPPADPTELSVPEYLKAVVTSPGNYLLVGFGFASFAVGIPLFVAITVVFSVGFTLVATPVLYWIPGVETSINTLPEALAASAVGVVVCLGGLHAVNLSAWLLAGLTERLLTFLSE